MAGGDISKIMNTMSAVRIHTKSDSHGAIHGIDQGKPHKSSGPLRTSFNCRQDVSMRERQTVTLEPISDFGRHRIERARRRLKNWDGKTWWVTELPHPNPGRMHVQPATTEQADWINMWIDVEDDPHVTWSPIAAAHLANASGHQHQAAA